MSPMLVHVRLVAHALFVIIQAFLADPVLAPPLRVLFQNYLNDVMVRVLQENQQVALQRFLTNRAYIAFHWGISPKGIFQTVPCFGDSLNELALRFN